MRPTSVVVAAVIIAAVGETIPTHMVVSVVPGVAQPLPTLHIDQRAGVLAAGLGHSADFAHQFHVAFSSIVSGACVFSGQPFHCATSHFSQDKLTPPDPRVPNCDGCPPLTTLPFDHCRLTPDVVDVGSLVDYPRRHCGQNPISKQECFDDVDYLKRSRTFLFRGTSDATAVAGAVENVVGLLAQLVDEPSWSLKLVADQPFGHVLPLVSTPHANGTAPAGYDGPGECLRHALDSPWLTAGTADEASWLTFDQAEFAEAGVGFRDAGWVYVPRRCRPESGFQLCRVVVRPDACDPASGVRAPDVDAFADYAEPNALVVLHPCVGGGVDTQRYPSAPDVARGKLDVYGQLGGDYTQQNAPHMRAVGRMVRRLLGIEGCPAPVPAAAQPAAAQQPVAQPAAAQPAVAAAATSAAPATATSGRAPSWRERVPALLNGGTSIRSRDGHVVTQSGWPFAPSRRRLSEAGVALHPLPTLRLGRVMTAGCSNTADFAHQLHVAFSSLVGGSCIFSGMPYRCAVTRFSRDYMVPKAASTAAGIHCDGCDANGTLIYDHCKNHPRWVELDRLRAYAESANGVDDPRVHLKAARVFAFGPTHDRCYQPPAMANVAAFHRHYATDAAAQVKLVQDQPFPHTLPTNATPFFNNASNSSGAGYDGPGECLSHVLNGGARLYPAPVSGVDLRWWTRINASEFVSDLGVGMRPTAWLFAPPQCRQATTTGGGGGGGGGRGGRGGAACDLLVLPGGCDALLDENCPGCTADGLELGSDGDFARYGAAHGIAILKPCQGGPVDAARFPHSHENLRGMVDVYGQLSADYATQNGHQMAPIGAMIRRLVGEKPVEAGAAQD